ncbi:Npun_R2821/Npun_R2822 family protein [Limnospira fusiformis]|uniref:Npun_R2821/Npun_R2822 family protein n=1 Tax=Limnospira fusiformis TaxID=54297 RepID=UPI001448DCD0|nr:sugar transferase [Limnospira fusiformis SAG 85.79]
MTDGIYTFANDVVYDQLVALLNSIEVNGGRELPVCIIPYNNQLDKIRAEVGKRSHVTLFDNQESIAFWEDFMTQAWKANQTAQKVWKEQGKPEVRRVNFVRKLCSFDGPFDKFIYMDADTLLMNSVDPIYQKLNDYDWVVNDFQYKSEMHYIYNPEKIEILDKVIGLEKAKSQIFCAGWFASKKEVFNPAKIAELLNYLKSGDAEVLSLRGSDQPLYNYMVSRSGISFYNFAYHNLEQATGSHWSSTFDVVDNVLYDKGQKITYIHFMSISAGKFTQLCGGEDVKIPYQDVFLHYRYLKSPSDRPQLKPPSWLVQVQRNLKNAIAKISDRVISKIRKIKRGLS